MFIFIPVLLILAAGSTLSQWNYGTPFSTSPQQSFWQQVVSKVSTVGNFVIDSLTAPYPTNAWFNHFFLYSGAYPNLTDSLGNNFTWVYPYNELVINTPIFQIVELLGVNSKPYAVMTTGGSYYPTVDWDGGASLFFGTTNATNFTPILRNDYTDISVSVKFYNTTNTNNYYYAPIVKGMPYVTMFYNNVTPAVYFPSPAVYKVNDVIAVPNQQFTGTSFKVQTAIGRSRCNKIDNMDVIQFAANYIAVQYGNPDIGFTW